VTNLVFFKFSSDVYVINFVVLKKITRLDFSAFRLPVEVKLIVCDIKEVNTMLVPFCPHSNRHVKRLRYLFQVEIKLASHVIRYEVQQLLIQRELKHPLLAGDQPGSYHFVLNLKKLFFI